MEAGDEGVGLTGAQLSTWSIATRHRQQTERYRYRYSSKRLSLCVIFLFCVALFFIFLRPLDDEIVISNTDSVITHRTN